MNSFLARQSTRAIASSRSDGIMLSAVAASILVVAAGLTISMRAPGKADEDTAEVPNEEEVSTPLSAETPPLETESSVLETENTAAPECSNDLVDKVEEDEAIQTAENWKEETLSVVTTEVEGSVASNETDESSKEADPVSSKPKLRVKAKTLMNGAAPESSKSKKSKLRTKLRALLPRRKSKKMILN